MNLKFLDRLFGQTIEAEKSKLFLPVLFCIILTSSTFFFFDYRSIDIVGFKIHLSMGLIFFPATFTIVNCIQDLYGKLFANTVVRYGFICDTIFVGIAYFLSYVGERSDYLSVYKQLPTIMGMTFLFVWISNILNTFIFEKLKFAQCHVFLRYFTSAFIAETVISGISIPLMMSKNNLDEGTIASIIFIASYKMVVTLILSTLIAMRMKRNNLHP
ncbi:VUT family protein [Serratia marcescens]|nr:VUT family protein [Serratia marcescens]ELQ9442539.1 VUT family protein [Serratia marcescens]ELT5563294.1 VUT family protein [Serratia marcescens]